MTPQPSSSDGPIATEDTVRDHRRRSAGDQGFTLPELLVAMLVLSILLLMLTEVLNQVQKSWTYSESRISQFREARVAFELISKSLAQAELNTYWDYVRDEDTGQVLSYKKASELHFITGPADTLGLPSSAGTHAIFFQAPLGFSAEHRGLNSLFNARGYYLLFGDDSEYRPSFYRGPLRNRYRLMEYRPPAEENQIFNDGDMERLTSDDGEALFDEWFKHEIETYSHPLAENIVALILSPRESIEDVGGTASETYSDIAPSYFYDSNNDASNKERFRNQLPPLVKLTLIAIDEDSAIRMENGSTEPSIVEGAISGRFTNTSQYETDLEAVKKAFTDARISFKIFSTMVAIRSSKWTFEDPASGIGGGTP